MSTDKEERWYVQFDSGDVTLMTLDEIQDAFEAGKIHANTYLIEVGETEWKTLSIVAGLDDEAEDDGEDELTPASTAAPTVQAAYAAPAYAAPSAQPTYSARPAQPAYPGAAQVAPAAQAAPSMRAAMPAAGGGWPPVATAAPQSVAPAARVSAAPPSYQSPYSMMPVVADLDVGGLDASSFKSGKKTAIVAALVALPAIGGGIYALTQLDAPPTRATVVAAAAAPAAMPRPNNSWSSPSTPTTPTPTTPTSSTSDSSTSSSDSATSGSTGKLSEDMKKALLANDSARADKKKAARAAAPTSSRRSGKKGSDVFKSGGAATDPLNSKL